jgi:hypothetical protein
MFPLLFIYNLTYVRRKAEKYISEKNELANILPWFHWFHWFYWLDGLHSLKGIKEIDGFKGQRGQGEERPQSSECGVRNEARDPYFVFSGSEK